MTWVTIPITDNSDERTVIKHELYSFGVTKCDVKLLYV